MNVIEADLIYSLMGKLKVVGALDDKNEQLIVVYIDEVHEFDKKWHPYFNKSYEIGIAKAHYFEPSEETDLSLDDLNILLRNSDIKVEVPKRLLKKIIYHAKELADSIDELLKHVPLDKLPREEDLFL